MPGAVFGKVSVAVGPVMVFVVDVDKLVAVDVVVEDRPRGF